MSIFEKYADKIDADALAASQKEITENASSGKQFEEVPLGKYEVKVEQMECKTSKNGNPMVSIWFKILHGKYQNSMIFYNGVFYEDWMRHRVVKMLADLLDDPSHDAEINLILKSNNIREINDFCLDIHEEINGKFEYLLDYGQHKGYNTYEIKEVYEA